MTELVFSTQRTGFEPGRHYQNPKYFEGKFRKGVTHVYVLGNWPKVVQAAEAFGIACTQLRPGAPISWKDGIAPVDPSQPLVEIPDTWHHFGNPRIIALAAEIAGRDVANRKQAVRIIEDELERRNPKTDDDGDHSPDDDENHSPGDENDGGDDHEDEADGGDDHEGADDKDDTEDEKPAKKPRRRK